MPPHTERIKPRSIVAARPARARVAADPVIGNAPAFREHSFGIERPAEAGRYETSEQFSVAVAFSEARRRGRLQAALI
jgi:hypothetical protein